MNPSTLVKVSMQTISVKSHTYVILKLCYRILYKLHAIRASEAPVAKSYSVGSIAMQ